jgi:DNA repair protein SbcC/Rad50
MPDRGVEMLTSLHLQNFQSHKDAHLEFAPGVNAIVGESDSGKTAILRALRWLTWNRPGGDDIRSSWGGDTRTQLIIGDDIIEREKGKENLYLLDGLAFKAFGTDVPEEIQKALNINEINFQQQLDRPFLLDDSPGAVAGHFNKIAHLDSIDRVSQLVQKWTRQLVQDITSNEKRIKEYEEALIQYENISDMEKEVINAETLSDQLNTKVDQCRQLNDLLMRLSRIEEEIEKKSELLPLEPLLDSAIALQQECMKKDKDCSALHSLIQKLQRAESDLGRQMKVTEAGPAVDEAMQMWKNISLMNARRGEFELLLTKIKNTLYRLEGAEVLTKEAQQTFDRYMPSTCPLCGQEIKK